MKKHLIMSFFVFSLFALLLSGCSMNKQNNVSESSPTDQQSEDANRDTNSNLKNTNGQLQGSQSADSQTKGPHPMVIDENKSYVAVIQTGLGDIEIELNAKQTPITVNNFVSLAKKGFYDNTVFHRAIKGFMIQGGDPKGDGTGGPGYRFDDEPFEGEYTRGTLAMANAGPNTNGSQFFIMHQDYPLSKNYVIFGKVTKGLEVVDKIAEAEVEMSPSGEMSKPVNPVKVKGIEIVER